MDFVIIYLDDYISFPLIIEYMVKRPEIMKVKSGNYDNRKFGYFSISIVGFFNLRVEKEGGGWD